MKYIELTKGKKAIVDNEDFEFLNKFKWYFGGSGYAYTSKWEKEKKRTIHIAMHRIINKTPKGYDTDHKNLNKLDNQKINLRTVTRSQNMRNILVHKDSKSGYKGISWHKQIKKWYVQIRVNKKNKYLGSFININEAITAYNNFLESNFSKYSYIGGKRK